MRANSSTYQYSIQAPHYLGRYDFTDFLPLLPTLSCHVPTLVVDYIERGIVSHHHPLEDDHLSLLHCLALLHELHSCLTAGRKTAIQSVPPSAQVYMLIFKPITSNSVCYILVCAWLVRSMSCMSGLCAVCSVAFLSFLLLTYT